MQKSMDDRSENDEGTSNDLYFDPLPTYQYAEKQHLLIPSVSPTSQYDTDDSESVIEQNMRRVESSSDDLRASRESCLWSANEETDIHSDDDVVKICLTRILNLISELEDTSRFKSPKSGTQDLLSEIPSSSNNDVNTVDNSTAVEVSIATSSECSQTIENGSEVKVKVTTSIQGTDDDQTISDCQYILSPIKKYRNVHNVVEQGIAIGSVSTSNSAEELQNADQKPSDQLYFGVDYDHDESPLYRSLTKDDDKENSLVELGRNYHELTNETAHSSSNQTEDEFNDIYNINQDQDDFESELESYSSEEGDEQLVSYLSYEYMYVCIISLSFFTVLQRQFRPKFKLCSSLCFHKTSKQIA